MRYNRTTALYNSLSIGDSLYIVSGGSANRNVGIGTTTPSTALDVNGGITAESTGAGGSMLRFAQGGNSTNYIESGLNQSTGSAANLAFSI